MSEKEELSENDILFEIEDLLSSRRKAAYLQFWRAGAGNEYWKTEDGKLLVDLEEQVRRLRGDRG